MEAASINTYYFKDIIDHHLQIRGNSEKLALGTYP